jgi:ubiquinone/menaquinone biosynthesis C-methylase UbiE
MKTSDFNLLDHIIAYWRLSKVKRFIKKNDVMLDFGCGNQNLLLNQVKHIIARGVGIDSHLDNVAADNNISYLQHEFLKKLPLKENSFDVITMLAVYEHIPLDKTADLLTEFYRVLKQNGILIMTVPAPFSRPILEFLAFNIKVISSTQIADHKKYYTRKCLIRDLRASKFELSEHHYFQLWCNNFLIARKERLV